ncbi:nuclear transport factor 2 family protein [Pseudomonas sp. S9]|uniref:nuclear transport factor 2 family protein n=1 Tax=Pseudomonas sp. S9 TaxID=686578 RepID=UPI0002557053|nr:nuclear transport factor 2 family protein [Pseudomonas sp. S9]
MNDFLKDFAREFAALNKHNLERLVDLYSEDAVFQDPLHTLHGLANIRGYFAELYANVSDLSFDFKGYDQVGSGEGYLRWTMSYRHPRLAGGNLIQVEGCSHLLWHTRVYQHRDYFDAGSLLYEHLPVLGTVISWLKGRLSQ